MRRGDPTSNAYMSTKNLSQRLERLESRLLPDTSEPRVLTVYFVSADGSRLQHRSNGVPHTNGTSQAREALEASACMRRSQSLPR
jgi:hypothetical protein